MYNQLLLLEAPPVHTEYFVCILLCPEYYGRYPVNQTIDFRSNPVNHTKVFESA